MRRTTWLLMGIVIVSGCGQTESTDESNPASVSGESAITAAESESVSNENFSERLAQLTKTANDLEADFQFGEAAETWRHVDSIVSEKFGSESWQAANAKLASIVASVESHFDAAQLKKLEQIQEYQKQFLDAFRSGDFGAAKEITDASTALTTELFGEQSPMFGKQLLQSASLNQKLGNTDAAIREYHQAINSLKTTFHAQHPDIESTHQQLGQLYLYRKQFKPAISNLNESTRLSGELWGQDSLRYAKGANQLGVAYHRAGELETAAKILQASELIRRRQLGPDHSLVAHSRLNLGIVYLDLKEYDLAEQNLSRAVQVFAKQDSNDQNMLTLAKTQLSTVHMLNGQPDRAEPLLNDAVEATYAKLGAKHPQVADLQYRQGIALARQGKYEIAEPLLNTALETQKSRLGPSHASTIKSMKALALLLKQTRRETEWQDMLSEIRRVSKASDSKDFQR